MTTAAGTTIVAHVTAIIEDWNSDDPVARIESEVGRDLPFIRINRRWAGRAGGRRASRHHRSDPLTARLFAVQHTDNVAVQHKP